MALDTISAIAVEAERIAAELQRIAYALDGSIFAVDGAAQRAHLNRLRQASNDASIAIRGAHRYR